MTSAICHLPSAILAEATPDANAFLQFWLIVGIIASVLANITTPIAILFLNSRRQKREIAYTFVPASKEEFDQHIVENKRNFELIAAELKQDRESAAESLRSSRAGIYEKLDKFRIELSTHTESVRRELTDKIDDVPDRVIATLRNTKAI